MIRNFSHGGSASPFRKRVVFDMHENLPASILHREWLPRILRRPLSRATSVFERLLLKGMPIVFAEKSYARVYPWVKTSTIVLNMPLVNEFRSITIPERNGPIVGYIGVVDPSRGSTILLDALRVLKGWGLPVGLELIGPIEPQHKRELRDLIEAYGLEGVNIRGYMDSIRGWKLLARCSLGTALSPRSQIMLIHIRLRSSSTWLWGFQFLHLRFLYIKPSLKTSPAVIV